MVNIQEIRDNELIAKIKNHEKIGGALKISVYEINENYLGEFPDEYDAHLSTARQALEKLNFECNLHYNKIASRNHRKDFVYVQTDFDKLDPSGLKIDLKHFLGPQFDLGNKKPLIRGQLGNETLNSYFYFDQQESPENKVDLNKLYIQYTALYPGNKGNFVNALMEPPFNLELGSEILKRGEYLMDFIEYFFSNIDAITIYSWDTNCSAVFNPGKEWWGSYFWTIYNPVKKWHIGIIASETD